MPAAPNRSGSTRRSSLPSSGRPSESARRFAGSIVNTATFLPRAAIPAAIAAELVVFPTPPEPAQMQTRFPSSIWATLAISASLQALVQISRQLADLVHAQLGLEDEGEGPHWRAGELGEAGQLLALGCGAV